MKYSMASHVARLVVYKRTKKYTRSPCVSDSQGSKDSLQCKVCESLSILKLHIFKIYELLLKLDIIFRLIRCIIETIITLLLMHCLSVLPQFRSEKCL